ncbi:MAG: hypothetical protein HYS17_11080 [Micavibrio aeruginosavorus]|uniref:Uncharacterized protein n=1 Tax=Micavibrio aeruginosavorus TaxID=349221 RepID=A0A7T5UH43_9BACT|nr:MAG: hypothetical protein HYS17_11080 [Micavibrio aeruginosavorus]
MGSLSSRPKAPDAAPIQYVYMPATTATAPSVSTSSAASVPSTAPTPGDEDVKAQARASNLLERRRGRLGTVLTSFRGLLGDSLSGARKTLLGE